MKINSELKQISTDLYGIGADAIIVGGSVRDHFLNKDSKDLDIEVYGLETFDPLTNILSKYGKVDMVGKSFGVIKLTTVENDYDFSFPRTESKVNGGHKGFEIISDGFISYETAFKRRDFTINAIGYDIEDKVFIDTFNGIEDIENKVLRHVDEKTFIEDPLRVYRAVQFVARFGLSIDEKTFDLCKLMVESNMLSELPKERVFEEMKKLLLKSTNPSLGFELMKSLGIIEKYFPEINAIVDVPQHPVYHPEGCVWTHTMMVIDKLATFEYKDDKQKLKIMFAGLCHDFGKATHTKVVDGQIQAHGHEEASREPTITFLKKLTNEKELIDEVVSLVTTHMYTRQLFRMKKVGDKGIRKLSTKVNIEDLVLMSRGDYLGRTTEDAMKGLFEAGDWLLERASCLNVVDEQLKPLFMGRDLIAMGFKPSPTFKVILDEIYELQINGVVTTKQECIDYVKGINIPSS